MRIRSIKPEFWRSDDVAVLAREDRLLFIGLWSYVDDNGVGVDDYRLISAALFPLDDDQKEIREYVQQGLANLSRGSLVSRYEVEGRRFLYITGWTKHQRVDNPNKARYPGPPVSMPGGPDPATSADVEEAPSGARVSRETPESRATGTEEQGSKRPAPSRSAQGAEPPGFAEFYGAYPRKRERKKAIIAYRAAIKAGATPTQLLQAAQAYAVQKAGKDMEYVKYPASWLNAGAYDDMPEPAMLALVPSRPTDPGAAFDDLRQRGDAQGAARLIGALWVEPSKPPSDPTPTREWLHARRVAWIDQHEQQIRAALTSQRSTA
jgi:hypothetical protein